MLRLPKPIILMIAGYLDFISLVKLRVNKFLFELLEINSLPHRLEMKLDQNFLNNIKQYGYRGFNRIKHLKCYNPINLLQFKLLSLDLTEYNYYLVSPLPKTLQILNCTGYKHISGLKPNIKLIKLQALGSRIRGHLPASLQHLEINYYKNINLENLNQLTSLTITNELNI